VARVAVLVPVGGFAPFLPEALDSLPDGVDVVVVDDAADPPVPPVDRGTLVRREARGGPAAARATGLAQVPDAEWIALCDADDAWEPGKLDAQLAHAEAGMTFGRATVVGVDGRPTGETWRAPPAGPLPLAELYLANPVPTSSAVLRRDALEAAGGFEGPVDVAEDWELWLRLARAGAELRCVPTARIRYRRHPGGLTADVARLAAAQQVVHTVHGDAVTPALRATALAADARALRRERLRSRLPLGRRDAYRRG
jgi:glycosyltransferase involved in cell wall biosynthesis